MKTAAKKAETVKQPTSYVIHQCRWADFCLTPFHLIVLHHCNKQRSVEENATLLFCNILPEHIIPFFAINLNFIDECSVKLKVIMVVIVKVTSSFVGPMTCWKWKLMRWNSFFICKFTSLMSSSFLTSTSRVFA